MADTKKSREKTPPLYSNANAQPKEQPPSTRWEDESPGSKTIRMLAAPDFDPETVRQLGARNVELFVVDESQLPGGERKGWRAAEVWTKRRVYALDSTFRCFEILDRETGRPDPTHEMLGARLGGGRLREKEAVRFSYPLPLPGMEAMFMKGKKHGYTSLVERMIVRIRVLHTAPGEQPPSWDAIGGRWSEPPPRGR